MSFPKYNEIYPTFHIQMINQINNVDQYEEHNGFRIYNINALAFNTLSIFDIFSLQNYLLNSVFLEKIKAYKKLTEFEIKTESDFNTIADYFYEFERRDFNYTEKTFFDNYKDFFYKKDISIYNPRFVTFMINSELDKCFGIVGGNNENKNSTVLESVKKALVKFFNKFSDNLQQYLEKNRLKFHHSSEIKVVPSTMVNDVIEGEISWSDAVNDENKIIILFNQQYHAIEKSILEIMVERKNFHYDNDNIIVYICKNAVTFYNITEKEIKDRTPYLRMRSLGIYGLVSVTQIRQMFVRDDKYFIMKKTTTKAPSVVSHSVLYYKQGDYLVSASHCQEGQGEDIYDVEIMLPTLMTENLEKFMREQPKRTKKHSKMSFSPSSIKSRKTIKQRNSR